MTYNGGPYWPIEYDQDTSCPGDELDISGCDDCPLLGTNQCPFGFRPTPVAVASAPSPATGVEGNTRPAPDAQ